jgi:hypothetical protein
MKKVCINKEKWTPTAVGPKFNEIVVITGTTLFYECMYYILEGYPGNVYLHTEFTDILPDKIIEDLMEEINLIRA